MGAGGVSHGPERPRRGGAAGRLCSAGPLAPTVNAGIAR